MAKEEKGELIINAVIVNEGAQKRGAVLISEGRIADIFTDGVIPEALLRECRLNDAKGCYLLPGVIDDQVHFREPGLTYKGDIESESRAAVAGGVTSFMDMPNTMPQTVTLEALNEKYELAHDKSAANYSFYIGATNDNLDDLLKTDFNRVCGVKVFMGASTGNMLVDNPESLERIFSQVPALVAIHSEKEEIVSRNIALFKERYGDATTADMHPLIRSEEACYASTVQAVALAKKHRTRLHVLHLSTAKETTLFDGDTPLPDKRITAEVCVHHLWFSDADYARLGNAIKWNPSIKTAADRDGLLQALLDGRIDVVATDHAPHSLDEKQRPYFKAPSGGPLIQHSLVAMLEMMHQGKISIEKVVEKMCHFPAILFNIRERGFIRKGYHADLVMVDLNRPWTVAADNILYKCGWSPFMGQTFRSTVVQTWVNGRTAYADGKVNVDVRGQRLEFCRNFLT